MFCRQSKVPWCLKFIPISCMGPRNSPKDTHVIFNQLWCIGACACSLNLNYAHKMPRKPSKCIKRPNEPQKIPRLNTTLLLFYVDSRNFLKAIRGNRYRPVTKGGTFPIETIMLVVRSSGLWEAYTRICPKWDKIFTTACRCCSMIACQVSWISDEFWIY